MTHKLKVVTIVGTRPEIIRLSRVLAKLDHHTDHVLVHTGQNYDHELNKIFFDELALRTPDHFLNAVGATFAETVGQIIARVDPVLEAEAPDAVLVLGDTNSCLAVIAAKRRKIPIFHMEAGNRCFDARVPEESNRKVVDHLADVNLPYSDIAREYLLRRAAARPRGQDRKSDVRRYCALPQQIEPRCAPPIGARGGTVLRRVVIAKKMSLTSLASGSWWRSSTVWRRALGSG